MGMIAFKEFMYAGNYDELPPTGKVGDIVLVNDDPYVWIDKKYWEPLTLPKELPLVPTNCKNCGGIVNKYRRKCEFCGTEY